MYLFVIFFYKCLFNFIYRGKHKITVHGRGSDPSKTRSTRVHILYKHSSFTTIPWALLNVSTRKLIPFIQTFNFNIVNFYSSIQIIKKLHNLIKKKKKFYLQMRLELFTF